MINSDGTFCQEDLSSADRGNVFCQTFEIQMRLPLCVLLTVLKVLMKATKMEETQAKAEQRGKISYIPKIDDSAKTKRR